jgi:hypothetical protein
METSPLLVFLEHLVDVTLPVAHGNDPQMRAQGFEGASPPVALEPAVTLLCFDR